MAKWYIINRASGSDDLKSALLDLERQVAVWRELSHQDADRIDFLLQRNDLLRDEFRKECQRLEPGCDRADELARKLLALGKERKRLNRKRDRTDGLDKMLLVAQNHVYQFLQQQIGQNKASRGLLDRLRSSFIGDNGIGRDSASGARP